jgi:light-independent protochlorophyllide reductase B subunit
MPEQGSKTENERRLRVSEIHRPSAFEGALWAVAGIKDAHTIFHSPSGCYINQHQNALMNDLFELYTSHLSYGDILQGETGSLEKTVQKLIAKGSSAIFVVTSPTVEIIKDDVEGVVQGLDGEKCFVIRPPIGGTVHQGKEQGFLSLISLMDGTAEKRERSVNLIGPTCSVFNWKADVEELRRMLGNIGVSVNTVIAADSTVQQIVSAPAAILNVCIYPSDCGVPFAQRMHERFGIPYLAHTIPIGFGESARWLEEIASFFDLDATAFLRSEIENGFKLIRSGSVFTVTLETPVALSLENHNTYAVGISNFFKKELGIEICCAAVGDEATGEKVRAVSDNVLVSPTIDEKKRHYQETSPLLIVGNFYDLKVSKDLGFLNFLFADIPTISYLATENGPYMGFRGASYLIQQVVNQVYINLFIETKGEMEGHISHGEVRWSSSAEGALGKIGEMIPHFIRTKSVKKLQKKAEERAQQEKSEVTLEIVKAVAEEYTPTRFKTRFLEVFEEDTVDHNHEEAIEEDWSKIPTTMEWDPKAQEMLTIVPAEFKIRAVQGTEEYARKHNHSRITSQVVERYRKELGF